MSHPATQESVDFLTRYQLLSPGHLETVARESGKYATPAALTDELVTRGWLTNTSSRISFLEKGSRSFWDLTASLSHSARAAWDLSSRVGTPGSTVIRPSS